MLELVAEVGVLAGRKLDRLAGELAEVREVLRALAGPVPRDMLRSELVRMDPAGFEVQLARRRPAARVNGRPSYGDGVVSSRPESWHPESGFNPEDN